MIDDWFTAAPQAAAFLQQCADDAMAGRALVTCFGRYRRFGLINADNLQHILNEARNFKIQSTTSDLTLISAMRLYQPLKDLGCYIINLVHDSILVEVPAVLGLRLKVAKLLREEMIRTPVVEMNSRVPFEAEIKYGDNWADMTEIEVGELIA